MSAPVPLAIDLTPHRLRLQWPDGIAELSAQALRAACRCGGCRGRAVSGEGAQLADAAPVGEYAVQLIFSDGHDRGIYPWQLLHDLSTETAPR